MNANELTVRHSADEGTTISGDTRPFVAAIKGLAGGFKWYRDGGCWYRQRSIGAITPTVPLERWAERLRLAGATVIVETVPEFTEAEAHAVRTRVAGERAERLEVRAERADAEATAAFKVSHAILDRIPMGQPILVGHHSEKRHRRDIDRSANAMNKGVVAQRKADRLHERVKAASLQAAAVMLPDDVNAPLEAFAKAVKGLKRDTGVTRMGGQRGERGGLGWRIWWLWFADDTALQIHVTARRINLMERMSGFASIPNGSEAYAQLVALIQAKRAQPREASAVGYGINR